MWFLWKNGSRLRHLWMVLVLLDFTFNFSSSLIDSSNPHTSWKSKKKQIPSLLVCPLTGQWGSHPETVPAMLPESRHGRARALAQRAGSGL